MKKLLPLIIGLSLGGLSSLSYADSLVQVYQQAKSNNPDLRKVQSDRDAAYEKISESRGALLPQLGLNAGYNINRGYRDNSGNQSDVGNGSLQLSQTIFDMSLWRQLNITEKQAGVQDVSYQAQQQKLILDTATAYFNVLRSLDTLSTTEAQKDALYRQLDQARQRFNVGLVAITDVQNAQAQYDQTLANEVTARNNLENALEVLRQISGMFYPELSSLDTARFSTKRPNDVNSLLKEAESRNLNLLTARLSQDLSRDQIKLQQTGHMPTVALTASTGLSNTDYRGTSTMGPDTTTGGSTTAGVTLSFPLFSGGQTNSRVKQAQYNYVGASEALEAAHRSVVQIVRSSYNNVSASISSVKAYQQSVVSAQSSLEATQAGYDVGTRTIVDVLNATTTLYNAKQQLSNARYDYLINQLNIQYALGTLNENDLTKLNGSLGKPVTTIPVIKTN
ncbi:outer membrane channel protein TolC [Pragia fontium]|uniref:Outer membrane protein TolC n=2 Tax=Pragia fontium TaxID=82985 RepID=A0AAJ4W9X2_9GAMM|nr:outer membrane channel protein TolC [Pragia fontium]AKJ43157.1 membrane protein [Pragia fontium]SFC64545.1 outer membrane protein [Pragia fontium DSM 5563 = ATCC 49100]SUB83610.1 Outer membrane protein tolC precursor [Pragia fontium]VEJ56515.1 Outer membrane protein tolC precursor [Pragia fontium]GKX63450.1 outer membrane channel protein [Pragia fontium]